MEKFSGRLTKEEKLNAIAEGYSAVMSNALMKCAEEKDRKGLEKIALDMPALGKVITIALATGTPAGSIWHMLSNSLVSDDEEISKLKTKRRYFTDREIELSNIFGGAEK